MSTTPEPRDIARWLGATDRQARRAGNVTAAALRRHVEAPPQAVWAACSDRDKLRTWFGDVSGDLREGATVRHEIGVPHKVTSRILRCEPPHHLLVTWWYEGYSPDYVDEVELRLTASGDGTDLVLEHRSQHGTDPAGVGPGWENWLFRLMAILRGDDQPQSSPELEAQSETLWNRAGH